MQNATWVLRNDDSRPNLPDETEVEVTFRNGTRSEGTEPVGSWLWGLTGGDHDIVAYKAMPTPPEVDELFDHLIGSRRSEPVYEEFNATMRAAGLRVQAHHEQAARASIDDFAAKLNSWPKIEWAGVEGVDYVRCDPPAHDSLAEAQIAAGIDTFTLQDFAPLPPIVSPFAEADDTTFALPPGVGPTQIDTPTRRATDKLSNPKDVVGVRKAPMSTVSAVVLAELGVAMLEGATKYGRHNYRAAGVRSSVYYDGTMRHLMAWWEGENIDPDSCALDDNGEPDLSTGVSHVTKAIASLFVLRDAMIRGLVTDDRPPSSAEFYKELNAKAAAIIDKHADKHPRHYTIADDAELRRAA